MKKQMVELDGMNSAFKKRLDAWLEAHYREDLSAEQISRGMLMHRSWLHRKMKATLGLSLKQYLVLYRLEQAKALFASSMALKEIAYEVGFSDYRDFARQINQIYHMPPSAMRSVLQNSKKEPNGLIKLDEKKLFSSDGAPVLINLPIAPLIL